MSKQMTSADDRAAASIFNKVMLRLSALLGLTTGIGIIAWGAWSMVVTVGMTVYERSGLTEAEVLIEDAFNQGLLQSAMLVALGVVILELRRVNETLAGGGRDG